MKGGTGQGEDDGTIPRAGGEPVSLNRTRGSEREDDGAGVQGNGAHRVGVLPLAQGVRWVADRQGEATKGTEQENVKLKRLVANLSLHNPVLKILR